LWDDMPNYVIYNSGHTQPVITDAEYNNSNNNSNIDPATEPDPPEPPEPSRDYRIRHMEKATMSRLRGPENGTYELSSDFPYYMGKHVIKKEIREIDVQEIGESEAKKIKTVHTIVVENGVITQHIEEANAEDENDPGE